MYRAGIKLKNTNNEVNFGFTFIDPFHEYDCRLLRMLQTEKDCCGTDKPWFSPNLFGVEHSTEDVQRTKTLVLRDVPRA